MLGCSSPNSVNTMYWTMSLQFKNLSCFYKSNDWYVKLRTDNLGQQKAWILKNVVWWVNGNFKLDWFFHWNEIYIITITNAVLSCDSLIFIRSFYLSWIIIVGSANEVRGADALVKAFIWWLMFKIVYY